MNFDALFFDIDGTLLKESKMMPEGIKEAFAEYGIDICVVPWRGIGMTDYQIVRMFLDETGLSQERKDELAESISEEIPRKILAKVKIADMGTCPGIDELIPALAEKGIPLGLLTGNLEIITGPKLSKAGLDPKFFHFGGFGDHSPRRAETARRALENAGKFIGKTVEPQRALIIGDTPNDIACAKAVGAVSFGVGTGKYSVEQLKECGADFAMNDLTDMQAFFRVLGC